MERGLRRHRLIYFGNDLLQALAVLVVSSLAAFGLWYWLWPFGARATLAAGVGGFVGLFCAVGSLLRGHDIAWERNRTRALPLRMRKRAKRRAS